MLHNLFSKLFHLFRSFLEMMTEYEKERLFRIQNNFSRMKALGVSTIAHSLGLSRKVSNTKGNGKRKKGDDEEYTLPQEREDDEHADEETLGCERSTYGAHKTVSETYYLFFLLY